MNSPDEVAPLSPARRLFLAIVPPPRFRSSIERAVRPLIEAGYPFRWLDARSYHVTLKFLGPVGRDRTQRIWDLSRAVIGQNRSFSLAADRVGAYPALRNPRVLWMGMVATPEMRSLKQDLEWRLAELGFEREARTFHPHVTVARAERDASAGDYRELARAAGDVRSEGSATIREIELLESVRVPGGVRYETVASAALQGETPDPAASDGTGRSS